MKSPRSDSGFPVAAAMPWIATTGAGLPYVDLRSLYVAWWPIVDFAIFAAIFVGVAEATVGRRLENRGGQLVSIGLGAMLAFGALGAEWALGLNLAALGPVAGGILLCLLAAALVGLLRTMGLRLGTALVVSSFLLAVALSAVSPALGPGLGPLQSFLQLVALLGILFVITRGVFGPDGVRGGERLRSLGGELQVGGAADPNTSWVNDQVGSLKEEKRSVVGALKPITRQERKAARRVLSELQLTRRVLERSPLTPEDRQAIAAALSRVPPARHELAEMTARLREATGSLQKFDNDVLNGVKKASGSDTSLERSALYRMGLSQREKIELERRLEYLEAFVSRYDENAAGCAQKGAEFLLRGDVAGARRWIDEAVRFEEEALKMIERTRALERMLMRASKREIRQAKSAA